MDPKYLRDKNEEEIDIVELLKRVKEGKAPKKIMIGGTKYEYDNTWEEIGEIYENDYGHFLYEEEITLDTKIKILDKPIIEELDENVLKYSNCLYYIKDKINEIIKHINKEEK